ncbi:hypothetical protein [Koleobacter methoxysyntrophicus]|nr:hypothetical protein [Koleobacter methoxysyntrophicus]
MAAVLKTKKYFDELSAWDEIKSWFEKNSELYSKVKYVDAQKGV